jgi:esterase/lipase superfamily enzyme
VPAVTKMLNALFALLFSFLLTTGMSPFANAAADNGTSATDRGTLIASAADTVFSAPVYFATDRAPRVKRDDLDFGNQETDNLDFMRYGINQQEIELSSANQARLGLAKRTVSGTSKVFKEDQVDTFVEAIRADLNTCKDRQLVVFIHGCCVDFEKASKQAAELSSRINSPLIMYDWGTPNASYAASLLAYPRGQERFNQFMNRLLQEFPKEKIVLMGYSLGNQLIVDYALQHDFSNGPRFEDVIIARADMDAVAFKSRLPKIAQMTKSIHLYVADNDLQINLSGLLRKIASPKFAGQRLGNTKNELPAISGVTVIDVSPLKLGHLIPYDVIADVLKNGAHAGRLANRVYREKSDGSFEVSEPDFDLVQAGAGS